MQASSLKSLSEDSTRHKKSISELYFKMYCMALDKCTSITIDAILDDTDIFRLEQEGYIINLHGTGMQISW